MVRITKLKSIDLSHFCDLICNLLDPRLVDLGSTLIYVYAYDP